ncbi:MAG: hypothetical protein CMI57_00350 [Parcubacteria group bacterium]|jgi:hypothetical protein|nr:hypothetical protein [Parcubacteria group bacterium]HJP19265.1 hypothetical protein [Nitrospinota bacterium]|tara:strand:+ start:2376 stop:2819 length:444 start_codon:yes stop_codon:yes gene_type:complete
MSITQEEFKYLIGLKKEFKEKDEILLGPSPMTWSRDLNSLNSKDTFIVDFYRGSIEIKKYTFNKRHRTSIVMLRYDSQGRHTNPPGTDERSFDGPHVHIYREGFDAQWAFPISELSLAEDKNMEEVLRKIFNYCNIINYPVIKRSLF